MSLAHQLIEQNVEFEIDYTDGCQTPLSLCLIHAVLRRRVTTTG